MEVQNLLALEAFQAVFFFFCFKDNESVSCFSSEQLFELSVTLFVSRDSKEKQISLLIYIYVYKEFNISVYAYIMLCFFYMSKRSLKVRRKQQNRSFRFLHILFCGFQDNEALRDFWGKTRGLPGISSCKSLQESWKNRIGMYAYFFMIFLLYVCKSRERHIFTQMHCGYASFISVHD